MTSKSHITDWDRRLDLRAVARRVLSKGPAAREGTGLRQRAPDLDRGQRHVLPHAVARDLPQMGERGAGRLRVLHQGLAVRHQPPRAEGGRRIHRAIPGFRRDRTRRQARPPALAVRAVQEIRRGRFRRLSRIAAGHVQRPASSAMSSRSATTASRRRSSSRCCGSSRSRSCTPTTRPIRTSPTSPAISSMRGCSRARTRSRPPTRRRRSTPGPSDCKPGRDGKQPTDLPRRRCESQAEGRAARRLRLCDPRGQGAGAGGGDGADRAIEGLSLAQRSAKAKPKSKASASCSPSATRRPSPTR